MTPTQQRRIFGSLNASRWDRVEKILGVTCIAAGLIFTLNGIRAPQAMAQSPAPPYGPGTPGYPKDIGGDRARTVPPSLSPAAVIPTSGIEVGVGGPLVSIRSHQLQFQQGPQAFMSDGALLSVDAVLDQWRFEYSKLLLRRALDDGITYQGAPVNFIGIDADQVWAFYGWWPLYNVYLGAGLGAEYRLTRLSNTTTVAGTPTTTTTPATVKAVTDNLALVGLLINWVVSPPITLKFRAFQEEGDGIVSISGTAIQIGFIVPF